ncbi:MAG TPA: hypothetical protein VK369_09365, partial [Segetibacter sp.]|nr:hypothetical protein [Segetibacter sp.]
MEVIVNNIFSVSRDSFHQQALSTFRYQYAKNKIYRLWVDALNTNIDEVTNFSKIPFLPVSFFKYHDVVTGTFEPEVIFASSGTTGTVNSKHVVKHLGLYERSF